MRKHLLVVNFTMDENHPALSHQREVVSKLSEFFEQVSVITGSSSNTPTAANVVLHEINWREGRPIRNASHLLYRFLKISLTNRPTAVFSHMVPIHAAITAPISRLLGIRHVLWYAHAATPISLRVAGLFVNEVLSSTAGSCNLKSRKVTFIGQGVDSTAFCFKKRDFLKLRRILYVGRLDPSKNISSIVSAVNEARTLNPDLELTLVGGPKDSIELPVIEWAVIKGPVARAELPDVYTSADVFLHAFQGSLDKVLIEATLSGLPVITVNNEFKNSFEIFGKKSDSIEVQLRNLLIKNPAEIMEIVKRNYKTAVENHEMRGWINRLVKTLI